MSEKDEKIDEIISFAKREIKNLVLKKTTGKMFVTIEINMTQGFIGSAFLEKNTRQRESIFIMK